jgi:hypothetical protein
LHCRPAKRFRLCCPGPSRKGRQATRPLNDWTHSARTAVMATRLHLERAQAASQTLAALGLAALVLDEAGKVLAANALIEGLTNIVHWRSGDRVMLMERRADQMLAEAVARIALNDNGGVRSFPVRDPATDALMVGHVVPVRFSARDIFARSAAVFILMPVAAPNSPPVELVMSLFDLTPATTAFRRIPCGCRSGVCSKRLAASARPTSWPCWGDRRRRGSETAG